jgi:uncharacterized protein (DUF2236 family)
MKRTGQSPVREYLHRLTMLGYLPRPFSVAFGPLNRFLTTGFLPPPFRDQMRLPWTERDQRQFESLMRMIATVNRLLPSPIRRFPFKRLPARPARTDQVGTRVLS